MENLYQILIQTGIKSIKILPNRKISVYGPPSSSGTRDTIEELVMSDVSKKIPEYKGSIKPYAKMVLISQVVKMII